VLVDDKPVFEFTPSILRCIVQSDHLRRISFAQKNQERFVFLLGRVTLITDKEATLECREDNPTLRHLVPYDYCVWATGVAYAHPIHHHLWEQNFSLADREAEFALYRQKVKDASE